jgi:hypothetical protein
MKAQSSLYAVIAISGAVAAGEALAATIEITGTPYSLQYGTQIGKNNVVGFQPSGLYLPSSRYPSTWLAGGSVFSTVDSYLIDWYFNGAESGDKITFSAPSLTTNGSIGPVTFNEYDQNNRHRSGYDPGWWSFGVDGVIGQTTGAGDGDPIKFTVYDGTKGGVENGVNNQKPGKYATPSLIFSYVDPIYNSKDELKGWKLTLEKTDWFAFAFDDPGSKDNDHDDYIGVAYVREYKPPPSPVPIPGALPLMGTVLGGGFFIRKWRTRRAAAARAA